MSVAVYPGSFDPVTLGHIDIVKRAAALFDRLYVAVLQNPSKSPLFTAEARVEMLTKAVNSYPNVYVERFEGLVVEYARSRGAQAMVRGLRAVSDFEVEFKMASMNNRLAPEVETLFLMTTSEYSFISSSIVKEVASLGGPVGSWVPDHVAEALERRFRRRRALGT